MVNLQMPDEVIKRFKNVHQEIINTLDQIQQLSRSYLQVKPYIRNLNSILLAHLGRQNNDFFNTLRNYYAEDRQANKMIEFLEVDTKDMKVKFLIFSDCYSGEMNDLGSKNFPREFQEYSHNLLSRIKMEEDYLFPLLAGFAEKNHKNEC